jgi:4-diphosphocytidyl-2-C-methyl-D-erythritol kinase
MIHRLEIGCKINLYLAITGVRSDGFHELETLFYPCPSPHDTLELEMADGNGRTDGKPGGLDTGPKSSMGGAGKTFVDGPGVPQGLALTCSAKALETPANLVSRAYEAFAARTGFRPGLRAHLTKRIPSGAGLGGGSADAAALLNWLNAHARAQALPPADLSALAAKLGADIPFFLLNNPAWGTGIGDVLEPAPRSLSGMSILVAVPRERVNTAWAYKTWDQTQMDQVLADSARIDAGRTGSARTGASFTNLSQPDPKAPLTRFCPASMGPFCVSGAFIANCFEAVVFRAYPAVRLLKERLLALGAAAACMSGSGSAVFGIFRDASRADVAASDLADSGTVVFPALL